MSDSKDTIIAHLRTLNLTADEATIYIELLREPSTHLRLSRDSGIARTKIYRLVEQLEKRSLVARRTDDRGTFLVAADPSHLEIELFRQEAQVKDQRQTLNALVPLLAGLQKNHDSSFAVRTYEGEEGLRQMCWHELKAQGELVALGGGTIEELVTDHRWAEKHRARSVEAGYKVREIINTGVDTPTFTTNFEYLRKQYACRAIPRSVLSFDNQTIIYNDTVTIYHHRHPKKIGVEIISTTYANMMRDIFELYWQQATPLQSHAD